MEKEDNYSASLPPNFTELDYQQQQHFMKSHIDETSGDNSDGLIVNYLMNNPSHHQQQQHLSNPAFGGSSPLDKLSFADVMQFADFGPKLALNQQTKIPEEDSGIDPVYFLKFPVLNDKLEDQSLMVSQAMNSNMKDKGILIEDDQDQGAIREDDDHDLDGVAARSSGNTSVQIQFLGEDLQKNPTSEPGKNKRKRPRTIKTTEEVESQRMTHIAVERNRRKQMNEHLRVLRSLMPGSYVQRGDQASIIGGAIEFVRELEQLLQCLESQKRRRLLGEGAPRQVGADSTAINGVVQASGQPQNPPFFPPLPLPNDQMKFVEFETGGLREETAENKSCLADVEVKLLGFDAMIKILSRRRPGQLIKAIAALEDLQFNILHTNITTIEQTVLYSFNVKVTSETRFNAEDIASSVQQIFSFIHANSSM
ncbi:hypothetical protein UlMin_010288 [Ulmus minor]